VYFISCDPEADFYCGDRTITDGSLDEVLSSTPLPATLPLFAGSLGMVGLLSRRRKWKAETTSAAA
jgi:hypothetical protein